MLETSQKTAAVIRLGSRNSDERVWVEDGEKELLWTVDQVLTACRAYNRDVQLAVVDPQVRMLWRQLLAWIDAHGNSIRSAYLHPTPSGRLLFLVVQEKTAFDQELTDALTELDMDVANDQRFGLLHMTVRAVPPLDAEQLDAILRPANQ